MPSLFVWLSVSICMWAGGIIYDKLCYNCFTVLKIDLNLFVWLSIYLKMRLNRWHHSWQAFSQLCHSANYSWVCLSGRLPVWIIHDKLFHNYATALNIDLNLFVWPIASLVRWHQSQQAFSQLCQSTKYRLEYVCLTDCLFDQVASFATSFFTFMPLC